jgi:hypothetical protein
MATQVVSSALEERNNLSKMCHTCLATPKADALAFTGWSAASIDVFDALGTPGRTPQARSALIPVRVVSQPSRPQ